METINNIELRDVNVYPDEQVLKGVLGESYAGYCALLKLFSDHGMEPEWRYYHDGKAWLCKVQQNKRTIVWMSAWKGYMQATMYFPAKHIDALFALDLSEERREKIRQTKNTGTSKPCIFEVRTAEVLGEFETVMRFKLKAK